MGKSQLKKQTVMQRVVDRMEQHPVLLAAATALLVLAAFSSVLWMTVFSGMNSATEFVYSKF